MASSQNSLEENLKCSICSKIFKDPVVLSCSHSFCEACLDKPGNPKSAIECQLCRVKTKRTHTLKNLSLGQACDSFVEEKRRKISICLDHAEKHQLFCVDDKKLVCMQCLSKDHENHRVSTIGNVASQYKTELQGPLKELQNKLQTLNQKKMAFHQSSTERIKTQVQQTEAQIKEEFEKLHQFLRDEEAARITALKEEEEEKKKKINEKVKKMEEVCSDLSERIKKTEDDMKGDESLFVNHFREIEDRTKFTEPESELDPEAPIDVVKHVGNLKYRVWEKMKDLCPYYPVLLVPGNRSSNFQLCKDLVSVRAKPRTTPQPSLVKSNQLILGSEGFTSGTHSWTVEVGTSENWGVGITSVTDNRANSPCSKISLLNGKPTWNTPAPKFTKVRVMLDCENLLVEYTDPDNNTALQRRNYAPAAKVYPCFFTFSDDPLKILPAEVSVTPGQ